MKTTTIDATRLETLRKQIAELEATPRALIGSDSGTHGKPSRWDLYEEISGERYAVYSFASANGSRQPIESAEAETEGRVRHFPESQRDIRAKQKQLKGLREELARLGGR